MLLKLICLLKKILDAVVVCKRVPLFREESRSEAQSSHSDFLHLAFQTLFRACLTHIWLDL